MTELPLDPIHEHFGLSYAQYLVIPRTVLQSMPAEWQHRFVACLNEIDEAFDLEPKGEYRVTLHDIESRQEITDPLANYERGRRRLKIIGAPTTNDTR